MSEKYSNEERDAMMQAHASTVMKNAPRKRESKTDLSYWFPIIERAGIPVPKTKIIPITDAARKMIWAMFDGQGADTWNDPFFVQLKEAANEMGYPCLRTDDTSGKHGWKETCFLPNERAIPDHVAAIAEFSECASMFGLPWDTWAVREMLPTIPYGVCPRYGNMPVCKEFRFFVNNGKVLCHHPYWPLEALRDGGWEGSDSDYERLCSIPNENELMWLAKSVGGFLGDAWSIDILETERGWFVTDLAEAHKSYHWEGCEYGDKDV